METKEKKKRQADPNLPKPCGFRVKSGESFWCMSHDGNSRNLVPFERFETEESLITSVKGKFFENKSSVNGILAENGNYYRTKEDCLNRISYISNKK